MFSILYFSPSGNVKHLAETLADILLILLTVFAFPQLALKAQHTLEVNIAKLRNSKGSVAIELVDKDFLLVISCLTTQGPNL